ncbi:MAG TPA: PEGA domain-containing protein [Kofleriaceae bacterium]
MIRGLALVVALAACGPKRPPNRVDKDDAIVMIKSNVGEANVYVDGRYYGPVKLLRGGLAFEAGHHRLELRHEDYFSRYVELDLARAEKKQLKLDLAPVLP